MDHNSRDGDLSSTRKLLTNAWTKRVDTAEIEIKRFKLKRPLTNDCKVVFFEIADDTSLHVNVTHRYPTKGIIGWAGPATVLRASQPFVFGERRSALETFRRVVDRRVA